MCYETTFITENNCSTQIKQPSDNILNILEIYSDGKMILDGQLIEVTRDISDENLQPLSGGASIYYTESIGYGSPSDYSHYYKQENISNIALRQKISNIALSTLVSIVITAMTMNPAVDIGVNMLCYILLEFIDHNSASTSLSSKSTVYTHKNYHDGYIPSLFSHIYKYKTTLYPAKNYGGHGESDTLYKHIMHDM